MITKDEVRSILASCSSLGLSESIEDDTQIVVDSYSLVWILHLLEERHGIILEAEQVDAATLTSADALHAHIRDALRRQEDPMPEEPAVDR